MGRPLTHGKVVGLIPVQGTCPGVFNPPWSGHVWEATNPCFSLTSMFLSLFPPSSFSKINENIHSWVRKGGWEEGRKFFELWSKKGSQAGIWGPAVGQRIIIHILTKSKQVP